MARVLPGTFSAKALSVELHGTAIMAQVFGNARSTTLDQLQEHLDARGQHAVAEADVVEIVVGTLKANINTTKHLMSELGWSKRSVKWGGADYARQLWVRPGYTVEQGKVFGPEGFKADLVKHLKEDGFEII